METFDEIFIVPFLGQGHLFPCIELSKRFSHERYKTTIFVPSADSSMVPSSLFHNPLISVAIIPSKSHSEILSKQEPFEIIFKRIAEGIETALTSRIQSSETRPFCAIIDTIMMQWCKDIFMKVEIPVVSFFTSSACASALEYAAWKADLNGLKPGESLTFPGLPDYMAMHYSEVNKEGDVKQSPLPRKKKSFPTEPGDEPPWVEATEGAAAFLFNTCDEFEHPFLSYIASQKGLPVWGIGPLLPDQYWESRNKPFHHDKIRPAGESSHGEEQIIQWLESKPRRSVIYVSFGSQVGPTLEEYVELTKALEESNRPFIWVLQRAPIFSVHFYPQELQEKVRNRGLIIHGWAPQLLILSHPSTGAFLTHCGWNSIVEAIGRGVPLLGWPIKGDQFNNAKFIESHLKVGCRLSEKWKMVKKDCINQRLERLMGAGEVQKEAATLCGIFEEGFPASSVSALNAFMDFISNNKSV